uniref:Uncharacterized protein n=1 Tax=Kalanchoe fedtschenkoi TaxID=63787 RepID=A0A7N0ZVT6_KALFE
MLVVFIPKAWSLESLARLLQSHGLPPGIFPENVESFSLDRYSRLEVRLDSPCYAEFENMVYFEKVVRANLSYGGLLGLQGLQQRELFLWLPVRGIINNDPSSGVIMIDIGIAHEHIALSHFDEPPVCTPLPLAAGINS